MLPSPICGFGFTQCTPKHVAVALGYVLAVTCLSLGCGASGPSVPQSPQSIPKPEAEFEWVIRRLKRALDTFNPSSGALGLRAKRELDYKLILPTDLQPNYKARVTITSKTFFKPKFRPIEKHPEKTKQVVDPSEFDALLDNDLLENYLDNPDWSPREREIITEESAVSMPSISSKKIFELTYLEGHWQLITPLESDRARNWFNYALEK